VTPRGAGGGHAVPSVPGSIWDVNQKSLYLRNDQLVAGHLQGANAALEGERGDVGTRWGDTRHTLMAPACPHPTSEKVFWVPNRAFEPARLPVILGIQNGTRCLASPPASQPTLQLQVRGHVGTGTPRGWGRGGNARGMGTPEGWGNHGDGDTVGMPEGWGHHRDGDAVGMPEGWGYGGDRDTRGMGTSEGWGTPEGQGHCADITGVGTPQGQGYHGDGDTAGTPQG